jgi:hypothetical protein
MTRRWHPDFVTSFSKEEARVETEIEMRYARESGRRLSFNWEGTTLTWQPAEWGDRRYYDGRIR